MQPLGLFGPYLTAIAFPVNWIMSLSQIKKPAGYSAGFLIFVIIIVGYI